MRNYVIQTHDSSIVALLVTRTGVRVRWCSVTTEMNIHGCRQNHALLEVTVRVCHMGHLERERKRIRKSGGSCLCILKAEDPSELHMSHLKYNHSDVFRNESRFSLVTNKPLDLTIQLCCGGAEQWKHKTQL